MGFGGGARGDIARLALLIPVSIAIAVLSATAPPVNSATALDGEETAFLGMINDYRAQNGLGPLSFDSQLNETARWMANDMASNGYFSHTDSLGRDPFARMDTFGYSYNTWRGENLAAGSQTAPQAFELWRGSPGHNANMLGANFTVIGIGRGYSAASPFGWYWATEFGGYNPAAPVPPPAPVEPTPAPYVPPPVEAPVPQPVAPQPTQEPPPPAPTAEPTPAPTPESTPTPAPPSKPPWWHSPRAIEGQWEDARSATSELSQSTVFSGLLGWQPEAR